VGKDFVRVTAVKMTDSRFRRVAIVAAIAFAVVLGALYLASRERLREWRLQTTAADRTRPLNARKLAIYELESYKTPSTIRLLARLANEPYWDTASAARSVLDEMGPEVLPYVTEEIERRGEETDSENLWWVIERTGFQREDQLPLQEQLERWRCWYERNVAVRHAHGT
jgi:hypothetical protein